MRSLHPSPFNSPLHPAGAVTLPRFCPPGTVRAEGPGQGLRALAGVIGVPVIDRSRQACRLPPRLKDGKRGGAGGGGGCRLP